MARAHGVAVGRVGPGHARSTPIEGFRSPVTAHHQEGDEHGQAEDLHQLRLRNDKHYKHLLVAWDENGQFDFSFYDESVDVSVDSTDAAAIKRVISARIRGATHFLCLVGKKTHRSRWVALEIEKAKDLEKKLVAVKIDRDNTSPSGLLDARAS